MYIWLEVSDNPKSPSVFPFRVLAILEYLTCTVEGLAMEEDMARSGRSIGSHSMTTRQSRHSDSSEGKLEAC